MTTENTRKPAPAVLSAPLTITLDRNTIVDLNAYRQASYAEQYPPVELTGAERLAFIKRQQQLAMQAALGVALFLNGQIAHHLGEPVEE